MPYHFLCSLSGAASLRKLEAQLGDQAPTHTTIQKWCCQFQPGHFSSDDPRLASGCRHYMKVFQRFTRGHPKCQLSDRFLYIPAHGATKSKILFNGFCGINLFGCPILLAWADSLWFTVLAQNQIQHVWKMLQALRKTDQGSEWCALWNESVTDCKTALRSRLCGEAEDKWGFWRKLGLYLFFLLKQTDCRPPHL